MCLNHLHITACIEFFWPRVAITFKNENEMRENDNTPYKLTIISFYV